MTQRITGARQRAPTSAEQAKIGFGWFLTGRRARTESGPGAAEPCSLGSVSMHGTHRTAPGSGTSVNLPRYRLCTAPSAAPGSSPRWKPAVPNFSTCIMQYFKARGHEHGSREAERAHRNTHGGDTTGLPRSALQRDGRAGGGEGGQERWAPAR